MKTMPRPVLRVLRSTVEASLTTVQWWEDRHADQVDYRMSDLISGLWQASQSLKAIIEGEFQPMMRQARLESPPQAVVLGDRYTKELLDGVPVPLQPVD